MIKWSGRFAAMLMSLALVATVALAPLRTHAESAAGNEVVFAGFGGTLEQLFRDKIIPAFEKETGTKVKYVVGTALSNYAKLLATRSSPEIDVYWSNELTHVAGKQQAIYAALDPAIVTNLADALPVLRDPDGIGVASYAAATVIHYNTQAFAEAGIPAPTSWEALWDPRLKGKVALLSFNVASTQDLLAIVTRLAGGTEADIRPGLQKLKALKDMGNLTRFAASPAEVDNMIVQKQAWITVNSSPRPLILNQRGAPVDASFPKEGAGFFNNYFDITKNAPHPKAAQTFVNFLIGPEMQRVIADEAVALPNNQKVAMPKALERHMPAGVEELKKFIRIDRVIMNRDLDNWADRWNREIESK